MPESLAFLGAFIHSVSRTQIEIVPLALIVVDGAGCIAAVHKHVNPSDVDHHLSVYQDVASSTIHSPIPIRRLSPGQFLIPGFVDTHNHAPQWAMRGLGQGLHILDWLERVTFAHEARFADPAYAQRVYGACVDGFLRQGVTAASYYASMHGDATRVLADTCKARGQRALVGKCCMHRNAPDWYRDASAAECLHAVEDSVRYIREVVDPDGALIEPVLTPRFAITCDDTVLAGLGEMVRKYDDDSERAGERDAEEEEMGKKGEGKTGKGKTGKGKKEKGKKRRLPLAVQTHFNEAEQEMTFTKELFPAFQNEADLYDHFGLLTPRTILAHCCFMTEHEMDVLRERGAGVAHCPISNMTVGGGFMAAPVRQFLRRGIKVGLGTDSGGGFSSSMLDAMRQAIIASQAREVLSGGKDQKLELAEVFWMATMGGAEVCGWEGRVGSFAVGKEFDALVVGTLGEEAGIMTMAEEGEELTQVFEKFAMTGDDRNIREVYVQGRQVKG